MSKVTTRPFSHDGDAGFIVSSFPRGIFIARRDSGFIKDPYNQGMKTFFKEFDPTLKKILKKAEITIACMQHEPDHILGYTIIHDAKLEWIYIKERFRNQKIGTLLLKNKVITSINEQNLTTSGRFILDKHPEIITKKDEPHESNPTEPNQERHPGL